MSDDIKRMDIKEFRETGFLHEANRLFFHPHGLALEIMIDDDGTEYLGGVWDYRDDPEGVVMGVDLLDPEKAKRVEDERRRHVPARVEMFGTGADIEPLDWKGPLS